MKRNEIARTINLEIGMEPKKSQKTMWNEPKKGNRETNRDDEDKLRRTNAKMERR